MGGVPIIGDVVETVTDVVSPSRKKELLKLEQQKFLKKVIQLQKKILLEF